MLKRNIYEYTGHMFQIGLIYFRCFGLQDIQ